MGVVGEAVEGGQPAAVESEHRQVCELRQPSHLGGPSGGLAGILAGIKHELS